jgi:two-component system chemotaxis response regulator CheY
MHTHSGSGPVLVIDDDADVREALCDLLRTYGFPVEGVSDGAAALVRLRAPAPPRLILLDLRMAGMDGYEFRAKQLRDPQISDIPVIVLTAHPRPQSRDESLGHVMRLGKPLDIDRLLQLVRRHCS